LDDPTDLTQETVTTVTTVTRYPLAPCDGRDGRERFRDYADNTWSARRGQAAPRPCRSLDDPGVDEGGQVVAWSASARFGAIGANMRTTGKKRIDKEGPAMLPDTSQTLGQLRRRIAWAFRPDEWWQERAGSIIDDLLSTEDWSDHLMEEVADNTVHISNDSGTEFLPWEAHCRVHRGAQWLAWAIEVAGRGPRRLAWQATDPARDRLIAQDRMERIIRIAAPHGWGFFGAVEARLVVHVYDTLAHHGRRDPGTWACRATWPDDAELKNLPSELDPLRRYGASLWDGRDRATLTRWLDGVVAWAHARAPCPKGQA